LRIHKDNFCSTNSTF